MNKRDYGFHRFRILQKLQKMANMTSDDLK